MDFTRGDYLRQTIRCAAGGKGDLVISFEPREGGHAAWWKRIAVTVHGQSYLSGVKGPAGPVSGKYNPRTHSTSFETADLPQGGTIILSSS